MEERGLNTDKKKKAAPSNQGLTPCSSLTGVPLKHPAQLLTESCLLPMNRLPQPEVLYNGTNNDNVYQKPLAVVLDEIF